MGSILLVEADPDTRERLELAVRQAGHAVVAAGSLREGWLRASEGGIDVIVVDAYDPRVGVAELVRNLDSLPDAPPLVLVSGSPHAPEISARVGVSAFVPKPFEPAELVAVLARLVGELRPIHPFDDEDPTGPLNASSR